MQFSPGELNNLFFPEQNNRVPHGEVLSFLTLQLQDVQSFLLQKRPDRGPVTDIQIQQALPVIRKIHPGIYNRRRIAANVSKKGCIVTFSILKKMSKWCRFKKIKIYDYNNVEIH